MPLTRKSVPGTIVRFEKKDGGHCPFVRFVTKDGQPVERLWTGHTAEDKGLQTDAAALARLSGYVVQVEYDTANPEYFFLKDWESPSVLSAPQTSMNFSATPKSKGAYLFPYKLIICFLVMIIMLGYAVTMFAGNGTKTADAVLSLFARLAFPAGYLLLMATLLYVFQRFNADSERIMVKEDVIYHYRRRNINSKVAEHRYSRIRRVDLVIAGRQRIRVYGEIEQVVNTASRSRKTYYRYSKTDPFRNNQDEVLAYQQSESVEPDSDKQIFGALNDPTGKKRTAKVLKLSILRTMENADFLIEKLRALQKGQSAVENGGSSRAG